MGVSLIEVFYPAFYVFTLLFFGQHLLSNTNSPRSAKMLDVVLKSKKKLSSVTRFQPQTMSWLALLSLRGPTN